MGIRRTHSLSVITLVVLVFAIASCGGGNTSGGSSNSQNPSSTPSVSSFSPASGLVGTSVTVSGTNLTGASAVSFNGMAASFTVHSSTQITASVPSGATTGKVSVTTPSGNASSSGNFTVTTASSSPTITSFSPTSGPAATSVTITGTNFTGATAVSLNGVAVASYVVNSSTAITITVPASASTGKFSVTTPSGSATSANSFTVSSSSSGLTLSIDGLYVTQATQDYPNPTVPLVKDRSGWVRVFVKANTTNTATPQVKVDFINGSTTNTLTINAPGASVPTSIDPNTNASWNAAVSSAWIQPGVQVVATLDPSNLISATKTGSPFTMTPNVETVHPWKVTLLPVHTTDGRTGTVESGSFTRTSWVDFAKRLHPVPDAIDVTVASTFNSSVAQSGTNPVLSSDGTNWSAVLNEISAKRTADGSAASTRYYFGVVKVNYTSGVAGLGFVGYPAAMGWDYTSDAAAVFAHEEGHNFNRQHSPCGGASNPDPNYPYPGALIGVTGWDAFASSGNLKDENSFTDIMGYCSNQWISDYVYNSELSYRASNSFDVVSADVASPANSQDALLVWGRIENGNVILQPAFKVHATGITPQPGPYTWQAKDSSGQVLMTLPFDAPEVADLPNTSLRIFSFVVPMSADIMSKIYSVHLAKDGHELIHIGALPAAAATLDSRVVMKQEYLSNHKMQFSWDARQSPLVMLRDAKTGEVRGFLSGGNTTVEDAPDDLEVQFSDGIHSNAVEYQRPAQ